MLPAIRRRIHSVFKPAFRLARPQKIKNPEQNDESQNSERKSGGNVVKPNSENERQEIHHRRRNQDVFPVALKNAESFQIAKNIGSGLSSSHCFKNWCPLTRRDLARFAKRRRRLFRTQTLKSLQKLDCPIPCRSSC